MHGDRDKVASCEDQLAYHRQQHFVSLILILKFSLYLRYGMCIAPSHIL